MTAAPIDSTESDERPAEGRSTHPLIGLGRDAIRGWGMLTAPWRPDPEFLVIGAKRGGSTSFYYDLLAHPQIAPLFPRPDRLPKAELTKGVHYFDVNHDRGARWYRSHLPSTTARRRLAVTAGTPVITGEASPYYLFHPAAADRAADLVPGARIIAVLRDPVLRTYSHWKERRRQGRETLDFTAALAAEDGRIGDAEARLVASDDAYSYAHEQQSYARQSEYAPALQRWYDRFSRDRILVLASEDYYADPAAALGRTYEFLGLPPLPDRAAASGEVRNAAEGDPIEPAVARQLAARFRPLNADLERLTQRRFPWPDRI
ncbi:sulfotransferase [Jatrophihabitans endophyticus]|uniref:sulfotransferase n=1 Tax=Jatrophihabitans endophyticus TaxID=1206085 RepID=UPI001A0494E8|nr:sulfotransferase [Jatrophihabitans endophyticus]MBE7189595.1 sulfotransferase [Jatrophihabitans endophyticus]